MIPDRSSKKRHKQGPEDVNEIAFRVLQEAISLNSGEEPTKDPLAVELGRRGGLKGGKARAAALTAEQRSEIARTAARKRWAKAAS